MNQERIEIEVVEECSNMRIDRFVSMHEPDLTRSYVQKLVKEGNVRILDKEVKSNYKVKENELVVICIPEPAELDIKPEDIPLNILYEDEDLIVINKEKGMVVHPAAGHYSGTLVNALLYHCKGQLSGINGVMRPGIVHRIDRDTTGVIVACKNDKAHNSISEQLKEHSITRIYHAIVYNHFSEENGIVDAPIGRHPVERKKMAVNYKNGKHAVTHYHVIENLKQNYSYISCKLETGRTHQIRVHMASIRHPLLGDDIYGPKRTSINLEGQVLHAKTLGFIHPRTGTYMEFESELPTYFKELISKWSNH
ncbi:RluA family pseudouridine synthase [Anaeromicropila populeti]|uniref:Pseudouridine synthase n=1 Tax=Anaeromicropila populeti TaxID=37658 RepID=A0A1I6L8D4_9FIRM|nr:RluA family pseudouridine synthase [Anaeromicropila populeti]SFR99763.1 23S rRNA pseudouridine1911/1915/1917 synthase [Anaeromicropila populeti]